MRRARQPPPLGAVLVVERLILQEPRLERRDVSAQPVEHPGCRRLVMLVTLVLLVEGLVDFVGSEALRVGERVLQRPRDAIPQPLQVTLCREPRALQNRQRLLPVAASRRRERHLVQKLRARREIAQHVGADVARVDEVAAIDLGGDIRHGAGQRRAVTSRMQSGDPHKPRIIDDLEARRRCRDQPRPLPFL